jgi:hypothetical protein
MQQNLKPRQKIVMVVKRKETVSNGLNVVGELESCNGGRKLVGEWQLFVREKCETLRCKTCL